jgi:hypothetical protein
MPLTRSNVSEAAPAPKASTTVTPFQPLDADILNASIPAFFIGRDKDGFWLARDSKGRAGGLFLLQSSAMAFARRQAWPSGCATVLSSELLELDVENQGNPLIDYLRPIMRFGMHGMHQMGAWTAAIAESIKRRF